MQTKTAINAFHSLKITAVPAAAVSENCFYVQVNNRGKLLTDILGFHDVYDIKRNLKI